MHVLYANIALALSILATNAWAHSPSAGHLQHSTAAPEQLAWGIAGEASKVNRVIEVSMTDDMRFQPAMIDIKMGETIRFVIHNKGQLLHEMVIGTKAELDKHVALMEKFPNMAHDEPYMSHVDPGKSGEIVWLFNRAGDFDFACLIPGHYQSGMIGKIRVTADKR